MPRDPKDISVTSGQRTQRRLGELDDQKDPIRLRIGSGPAGAEGKEGKAGTNGATWYTGAGAPASELGVNNDLYLRTSNDEVYKKVAGVWTELVNIKGEKGEGGATDWTPIIDASIKQLSSNTFEKATNVEGDATLRSAESFTRGCYLSWVAGTKTKGFGLGLNTDPATDEGFTGIDYFLNCTSGETLLIRESGVEKVSGVAYAVGDVLSITYDGTTVRYWKNGELLREVARAIGSPLLLDSWWNQEGGKAENVHFGPMGETGEKGATGPSGTGAPLPARLATAAALPAYTRTTNKLEANANGALGKIDEVTAAVNDLVLLKDGAAGADNGVYKITSVGGTLSKWTMERYESMDTSPEAVPGMLITVSEGARNKDEVYQLTTDAAITLNTTALTFKRTAPRDFGLVEALPTSEAIKGDKCQYIADKTNGVIWNLVYDGEGEFPWKKIGGPALYTASNTERSINNAAYTSLPTDPLNITAPLKGDYRITIEAALNTAAALRTALLSYAIGATVASDNWALQNLNLGQADVASLALTTLQSAVAASAKIEEKARSGEGEVHFSRRRLTVDPVRVG